MNQAVLADVEIACAGAATPVVTLALRDIVLEGVDAGEAALLHRLHFEIDATLFFAQRLQLAAAVVNDADGRTESEGDGAFADGERVLRITNAAADHGIDVHMKVGVFGQQFELAVENFQAFLRDVVGIDVVDGDLQPLESGAVEALNPFRDQQIAIRDQAGDHAVRADTTDYVIEFRVEQRLTAGNRHHRRAQRAELVDAAEHFLGRYGIREIVELVAVGTSQVTAAYGDDVRQQRMIRRSQGAGSHRCSAQVAVQGFSTAAQGCDY